MSFECDFFLKNIFKGPLSVKCDLFKEYYLNTDFSKNIFGNTTSFKCGYLKNIFKKSVELEIWNFKEYFSMTSLKFYYLGDIFEE